MRTSLRIIGLAASALVMSLSAGADERTEAFVRDNGDDVLRTLNDTTLDSAARTELFAQYMVEFTDFEAISRFVIGPYARRFSETEFDAYSAAFRRFALANYRVQFDRYRGTSLDVTGSVDRNARDSVVETVMRQPNGEELEIKWRVLERSSGLKIVDVGLNIDGNLLWLAIEQRAQFLALLDRENGSATALTRKLDELTADLEAEIVTAASENG